MISYSKVNGQPGTVRTSSVFIQTEPECGIIRNQASWGSTITFRWELHGNKLKLQEIDEDSKDSDSGLTVSYTITNHTQYTIDLWEENSVVDPEFTLFLKES